MRRLCFAFILVIVCANLCLSQCHDPIILANVLDKYQNQVPALGDSDFAVILDGKEQQVNMEPISKQNPPRIVILMDRSASMERALRIENYATLNLLFLIPDGPQVAVAAFSEDFRVISEFSSQHQQQARKLRDLFLQETVTTRYTAQSAAIEKAMKLLEPSQIGDSIVILGDGGDNRKQESLASLEKRMQQAGVRLFFHALLVTPKNFTPEESMGVDTTKSLAESSGGAAFINNDITQNEKKSEDRISEVSRDIISRILNPYALRVARAASTSTLQKVRVQVPRKRDSDSKTFRLEYPHKINSCPVN
jgi:Mg-chelatase subunit ChlD